MIISATKQSEVEVDPVVFLKLLRSKLLPTVNAHTFEVRGDELWTEQRINWDEYDMCYDRNLTENETEIIKAVALLISKLVDNTAVGGFSEENLKEIIISPFGRIYNYKRTQYAPVAVLPSK